MREFLKKVDETFIKEYRYKARWNRFWIVECPHCEHFIYAVGGTLPEDIANMHECSAEIDNYQNALHRAGRDNEA